MSWQKKFFRPTAPHFVFQCTVALLHHWKCSTYTYVLINRINVLHCTHHMGGVPGDSLSHSGTQ